MRSAIVVIAAAAILLVGTAFDGRPHGHGFGPFHPRGPEASPSPSGTES